MCEKYKLGLTRNRLFEFDNCVVFCGKAVKGFSVGELSRVLKLLCVKEPIINTKAELCENGDAFIVAGGASQQLVVSEKTADAVCESYKRDGIDFWEKLFEFTLSSDGVLVIAAHTVVADAKSLLNLARYIAVFYNNKYAYAEDGKITILSEMKQMPIEVVSPIIDRLSVNLEDKWNKKTVVYGLEDYQKARFSFLKTRSQQGESLFHLGSNLTEKIKNYAREENLDVSSVVAWAFYESLVEEIGGKEKYNKMCLYSDRRFFFDDFENFAVGANNGAVTVGLSKKERKKSVEERVKKFHLDCYKSLTSVFRSFYEDYLLMKLSPSFCDSAYMYRAGMEKNKASKRLAENYSCDCEKNCDFFSCNIGQAYWQALDFYSSVKVSEPLKSRFAVGLSCILLDSDIQVLLKNNKDKCSDETAKKIVEKSLSKLEKMTTE